MDFNNHFVYSDGLLLNKATNKQAGSLRTDGYVGVVLKGKYFFAHRIIWEMHNGSIPKEFVIDHIDGDRSNNKLENLRLCTFQQNHFNRGKQANNKSGFKGVSWHKQKAKWVAQIKVKGKNKFLGFFNCPEEAYKAYCDNAIIFYGYMARF